MALDVRVSGLSGRFDLSVVGREYPDATSGSDRSWLVVNAEVVLFASGSRNHQARTRSITVLDVEIRQFANELRAFADGTREDAQLSHIEEEIGIHVVREHELVKLHGYLATGDIVDSLHMAMIAKQDRIPATLRELDAVVTRYPPD